MNSLALFLLGAFTTATLQVSSPAFKENGMIPSKYTCEGDNINPTIYVKNIPQKAKSLALIMDDPDAPMAGGFTHWVAWNIDPAGMINEKSSQGVQGKNGGGKNGYTGPCPPGGTHHYHFKVYALNEMLTLKSGADKKQLEDAMKGHILATGEVVGLYKKIK